jgi:hypothetical protein
MSAPTEAVPLTPPRVDGGAASTSAAAASDVADPHIGDKRFVLGSMKSSFLTVQSNGWPAFVSLDDLPMEAVPAVGEKAAGEKAEKAAGVEKAPSGSKARFPRDEYFPLHRDALFQPWFASLVLFVWTFVMTHGVFPGALEGALPFATLQRLGDARTSDHEGPKLPEGVIDAPCVGKALFATVLWLWGRLPRREIMAFGLTMPSVLALIPG